MIAPRRRTSLRGARKHQAEGGDPLLLRHQVDLSNWKLDPVLAANAFTSVNAANARKIPFAAPQPPAAAAKARTGKAP